MIRQEKVLGQTGPAAATNTLLYAVPGFMTTRVTTLIVCNRGGAAAAFRAWMLRDGASIGNDNALYYDKAIPANDTIILTVAGLTMPRFAELWVYASTANLTFQAFGIEQA